MQSSAHFQTNPVAAQEGFGGVFQNNTPGLLSTFRACVDWLGNLRAENESLNDDISADAVRIASLELALRQANIKAMVWQVKAEDLQDKLEAAQPLIDYAKRRKDSLARYELRRAK